MKWNECEAALHEGKKIKLASWKNAYWYLNEDGELINHFEEGQEVPTTALFPRDLIWVAEGDWVIVDDVMADYEADMGCSHCDGVVEEKAITQAEYNKAVKEVMQKEISDPKLEGMGKVLIPMVGMIFAKKIAAVLFGSEAEDKEDNING